ncbi:MAG: hypothetical protein AAFU49_11950, partial [Pseudomonadota bacterium]
APRKVRARDLLSHQCFDGTKVLVLTIVDATMTLSPAIDVRLRFTRADVMRTLERVATDHGLHNAIPVDQGPLLISKDFDLRAHIDGAVFDISRPELSDQRRTAACVSRSTTRARSQTPTCLRLEAPAPTTGNVERA